MIKFSLKNFLKKFNLKDDTMLENNLQNLLDLSNISHRF